MDEAAIRAIIKDELRKAGADAYQTRIGANWTGSDIATDDILSGAAGSETSYSLAPLVTRYPVLSEAIVMLPFGGGKSVAGRLTSLHSGLPASGAYWFPQIVGLGATETTLAVAGRAIRVFCPVSMLFTKASIEVTTLQAASNATIKVYSSDGTQLWTSGNISTAATGFISSTPASSSPVAGLQLNQGWFYIIEYANSDATVAVRAMTLTATSDNHTNDSAAQIASSAANLVANSGSNNPEFCRIKLF